MTPTEYLQQQIANFPADQPFPIAGLTLQGYEPRAIRASCPPGRYVAKLLAAPVLYAKEGSQQPSSIYTEVEIVEPAAQKGVTLKRWQAMPVGESADSGIENLQAILFCVASFNPDVEQWIAQSGGVLPQGSTTAFLAGRLVGIETKMEEGQDGKEYAKNDRWLSKKQYEEQPGPYAQGSVFASMASRAPSKVAVVHLTSGAPVAAAPVAAPVAAAPVAAAPVAAAPVAPFAALAPTGNGAAPSMPPVPGHYLGLPSLQPK